MRACRNTGRTNPSSKITIDEICKLLKLPTWDDVDDLNRGYYDEAVSGAGDDAETDEEREAALQKAETAARDELFSQWHGAVMAAADKVFDDHGLALVPRRVRRKEPKQPFYFNVRPNTTWEDAALKLIDTINGVGYFYFESLREFIDQGPYTVRKAVLNHLGWMKDRADVYGEPSAQKIYERAWR